MGKWQRFVLTFAHAMPWVSAIAFGCVAIIAIWNMRTGEVAIADVLLFATCALGFAIGSFYVLRGWARFLERLIK